MSRTSLRLILCGMILFIASLWRVPELSAQTGSPDSVVISPGKRAYLEPNYPNPFPVTTHIAYTLSEKTHVTLTVHDFFYDTFLTLVDAEQSPGRYVIEFVPPLTVAAGSIFYTLKTGDQVQQRRMLYVK